MVVVNEKQNEIDLEKVVDISPAAQVVNAIIGTVSSICASEVVYLGIKALVPETSSVLAKMVIGFGSLGIGTWVGNEVEKATEQPVKEMLGAAVIMKAAILEEIDKKKLSTDN